MEPGAAVGGGHEASLVGSLWSPQHAPPGPTAAQVSADAARAGQRQDEPGEPARAPRRLVCVRNRARRDPMPLGPGHPLPLDVMGDIEPDVWVCEHAVTLGGGAAAHIGRTTPLSDQGRCLRGEFPGKLRRGVSTGTPRSRRLRFGIALAALALATAAGCGNAAVVQRPGHAQLVHLPRVLRRVREERGVVLAGLERRVPDQDPDAAERRRRPAPADGAPPGGRRLLARHPRPRRHLDAGVRRGRLDHAVAAGSGPEGRGRHAAVDGRHGHLEQQALLGAVQHEHAAPLVPQGPGPEPAQDVEADDRDGRRRSPSRASRTTSRSRARSTRATRSGSTRS